MLRIVAALFAIALLSTPMAAQAQATLDEARAYVKAALPDLPKGIPGYDINDRPVGWDEMILDTRQDSIQDLRLTPYGGYVIALACDQDCRGMGVEVFDHLGQSIGGAHGSTKLAFAFNGGGLMHLRIWISACDQPQCYLAYNVIQLD